MVCVWGIESKQNTGVSKANSASSYIWLINSESRMVGERIAMHQLFLPSLLCTHSFTRPTNAHAYKQTPTRTYAFRHAALSSFFSSWSSPALRLGLPSVLVTPFPIRVSSEMSLLHLKDSKTSKKLKWKINITKLISNTFNTCKYI